MRKVDREFYIEWLTIWTSYTKEYWDKQSDEDIEQEYYIKVSTAAEN